MGFAGIVVLGIVLLFVAGYAAYGLFLGMSRMARAVGQAWRAVFDS